MYLSAGPPIGGLLYSLGGKGLPFFILSGLFVVAFWFVFSIMFVNSIKVTVNHLQSNLFNTLTKGTEPIVRFTEVSVL